MIFVTVGTHEQSFNRLIMEVDRLVAEGVITEEVFIQTGFSTYEPQHCSWKKLLSYDEMDTYIEKATTVITHGGPATFMAVLAKGKKPVVVPRQEKFGEHVNDHQMEFCKRLVLEGYGITLIEKISELGSTIGELEIETITSNNNYFTDELSRICQELLT